MKNKIRSAWTHPVTPLVFAAVATAIFFWGVYPEHPIGAVVMTVLAWIYNIAVAVRRHREAGAFMLTMALLIATVTVGTPVPVAADDGECTTSARSVIGGAVAGAGGGGLVGMVLGIIGGAIAGSSDGCWDGTSELPEDQQQCENRVNAIGQGMDTEAWCSG